MGRFSYAPAVQNNSAAIRSEANQQMADSIGNSIGSVIQAYGKKKQDTDHMRGIMETMASKDPEIAGMLDDFEKSGYSKKQAMVGEAVTAYKSRMEMKMAEQKQAMELAGYAKKQEIAASYRPDPAEAAARDLATYQAKQDYSSQKDMDAYRQKQEIDAANAVPTTQEPIPGTNYLGVYQNGQLKQALPMTQGNQSFGHEVDPATGAIRYQAGGRTVDPGDLLVPAPGPYATGQAPLVPLVPKETKTAQPKVVKRSVMGSDGTATAEEGYWTMEDGTPVWNPVAPAGGGSAAAGGGGGSPFSRWRASRSATP